MPPKFGSGGGHVLAVYPVPNGWFRLSEMADYGGLLTDAEDRLEMQLQKKDRLELEINLHEMALRADIITEDQISVIRLALSTLRWQLEREKRAVQKSLATIASLRQTIELNPGDGSGPGRPNQQP